jgi:hypothetical protein
MVISPHCPSGRILDLREDEITIPPVIYSVNRQSNNNRLIRIATLAIDTSCAWRRNYSKLYECARRIILAPVFYDLAVGDAEAREALKTLL